LRKHDGQQPTLERSGRMDVIGPWVSRQAEKNKDKIEKAQYYAIENAIFHVISFQAGPPISAEVVKSYRLIQTETDAFCWRP
jgi:hypothetical protein